MDVFKTLIHSQPGAVGSTVAVTGGSINGTNIGSTTPGTGAFTTLTASGLTSITNTTSASASNVGAFQVGNGTAATNVAIGGGVVSAGERVRTGPSTQSPSIVGTGSVTVTTSTTELSATSLNTGAIAIVSGYNNSGGSQGVWLLIATSSGTISTVASANATGLTPTFSVVAGKLNMALASGSMTVVTQIVGLTGL